MPISSAFACLRALAHAWLPAPRQVGRGGHGPPYVGCATRSLARTSARRNPPAGTEAGRYALLLTLGAIAIGATVARADGLPREQQGAPLQQAQGYFDQGVNIAAKDPAGARERFRQSAAAFRVLCEGGAASAGLEYNAGNAAFRAGDIAQAVLHLRRALRLEPAAKDVRANLDYVRERVTPQIAAAPEARLLRSALGWHYATSLTARWWFTAAAGAVGWLLLFVWLRRRGPAMLGFACVLIVGGAAAAGSLLWQLHFEHHTPDGVVIAADHVLRVGRGEGYEPALREPLGPGVELRMLETRGDWVRVRLVSEVEGWLPASGVERVCVED